MAADPKSPQEIARALNRQARTLGVFAMVVGGATIGVSAWLVFATEEISIEMLFCFATIGLLSLLAGYQKIRTGYRNVND